MSQIDKDPDRFWSKVEKLEDGCWIWHGVVTDKGACVYHVHRRKLVKAHRVAWEETRGPIPEGAFLLRTCLNPRCISPHHRMPFARGES